MKLRTTTIVFMLLLAGMINPIQAQWGLDKIVKKAKKTKKEITKTVKEAKKTKNEINSTIRKPNEIEKKEEETQKSPWRTATSQQDNQTNQQKEQANKTDDEPTNEDLKNMANSIESTLFHYGYTLDVKEMDGKKYLVFYHQKDMKLTLAEPDVKKIVAIRDALGILEHYKYQGISKKQLNDYKKRVNDIIEGNNNSVKHKREEAYKDDIWKSHKSKAKRLAEIKERVKKARMQKLSKNIKILDMAIEDHWGTLRFSRGIHRVKKESIDGDILYYDPNKKKYMRVGFTVYDEYYIDHPNDKEKKVSITTPKALDIKQVPKKFRKY